MGLHGFRYCAPIKASSRFRTYASGLILGGWVGGGVGGGGGGGLGGGWGGVAVVDFYFCRDTSKLY